MRADVYITNTSDKVMAVGMTTIAPGKTEKVLQKDFERKASYVDRMIKEKKLAFARPNVDSDVNETAPANDDSVEGNTPLDTNVNEQEAGESEATSESEGEKAETNEADALTPADTKDATEPKDETEPEVKTEEVVEAKVEVAETVSAPKRAKA